MDYEKVPENIQYKLYVYNLPILYLDSSAHQFKSKLAYEGNDRSTQVQLNQLQDRLGQLPIYRNFLFTEDLKVHMMLITLDQKTINNKSRITLVKNIKKLGDDYAQRTKHPVHYSGMPFIRTELTAQVTNELILFLKYFSYQFLHIYWDSFD
jgi:hypothetical protein